MEGEKVTLRDQLLEVLPFVVAFVHTHTIPIPSVTAEACLCPVLMVLPCICRRDECARLQCISLVDNCISLVDNCGGSGC